MAGREYDEALAEAITNLEAAIGADARLHRPIAAGPGGEQRRQVVQRGFAIDEVRGPDDAPLDEIQCGPDGARRVMETGQEREVRIVQQTGVERDRSAGRAAPEKIHPPPFAHQPGRRLPGGGLAHGFEHPVERHGRQGRTDSGLQVFPPLHVDDRRSPEPASQRQSALTATRDRHGAPGLDRQRHREQPDGSGAHHQHLFTGARLEILDPLNHTGQRLGERGGFERSPGAQTQQIPRDDPRRDHDRLGIGSVQEQQVVAEVFLPPGTPTAPTAGSRVGADHPVARNPPAHIGRDLDHRAGQLVTEDTRRGEHPGVVPPAVHLQIGPAGQCRPDPDPHLTRFQ
jgi:hypothetical protein